MHVRQLSVREKATAFARLEQSLGRGRPRDAYGRAFSEHATAHFRRLGLPQVLALQGGEAFLERIL